VARSELDGGIGVLAAFVTAGLTKSNGETRRQLKGGGVRVNDEAINDEKAVIGTTDLSADGVVKLSLGKKRHVLLRPV
jgi:tyrosyl-tRNA synthetase